MMIYFQLDIKYLCRGLNDRISWRHKMRGKRILVISLLLLLLSTPFQILSSSEERTPLDSDPDINTIESNEEVLSNIIEDEVPSRDISESPWPMFKQNPQHTGLNLKAINDNPGRIKWKIKLGSYSLNNGAIINSQNNILIGMDNTGNVTYYSIYKNNSQKWRYIIDQDGLEGHICLDEFGNLYFTTDTRRLISLDSNGFFRWSKDNISRSSPIYHPSVGVVVWDRFGNIISYNINGTERWSNFINDWNYHPTPAIAKNGSIYSSDSQGNLISLNSNGELKWKVPMSCVSIPTIDASGNIYIGSLDGIYCIYPNGSNNWYFETNDIVSTCPSINLFGDIIFGSEDGYIYSLYSNGSLKWSFQTSGIIENSSPAIDGNNVIYIGSRDSYLYSLYPNGTLKWKLSLDNPILDSPAIDNNGNIYISTNGGNLFSIGVIESTIPANISTYFGNNFINTSWDLPVDDGGAEILNFNVYRNTSGNDHKFYTSIPAGELFFNDTDVINGVEYSYWITTVNREGESDLAGPFNATPRGPPSTPRNVSVSSGPGYLNISWEGPLSDGGYPVEGYRVYRKESGVFLLHGETNDSYFIDLWANQGVNYSYYITAVNEYGESIPTPIFWGMSIGVPPTPYPLTIGRYDGAVRINWTSGLNYLMEYDITHVRIYRDGSLLLEVPAIENYYNDTGLINGVVYRYQVSSVNILGEGDLSNEFEAVPGWSPSAPRNLSTWANTTMVKISWDPPEFIRGFPVDMYIVYRKTDDGRWINLMNVSASNNPHWNDTYVEMGNTYDYKVIALNERGASPEAGPVSATTPMGDPPERPGVKSIALTNEGKIEIEWNGPQNEDVEYSIFKKIDENGNFGLFSTTIGLVYSDTPTTKNVTYYYYIIATNQYGDSPSSDVLSIFVPAPGPNGNGGDPENNSSSEKKFPIILAVIVGVVILLIVIAVIIVIVRRKDETEELPREKLENNDYVDQDDVGGEE